MKKTITCLVFICGTSISSFACEKEVASAKELIGNDGLVKNEKQFVEATSEALIACKKQIQSNPSLRQFAELGMVNCKNSQEQGQSDLYLGHCYLKVADATSWLLGPK